MTGMTPLMAAWLGRLGLVGVVELIGPIPVALLFRFAPKRLGLELAVLASEVFDFLFQLDNAPARLGMHALPVPGLLPQFEILSPQSGDFAT